MNEYVLADDLSGALEAGAAFRTCGWRAVLPLHGGVVRPDALRILSTETRNLPAEEAVEVVRRVVSGELAKGGRLVFKKIDSTWRGPLGAELAVVRELLQPKITLLCPANPAAGRTIRDGIVRVHGVPLSGTDFRNDPFWPAATSSVVSLLAAHGIADASILPLTTLRLGAKEAAAAIRAAAAAGHGVVVAEAELARDLPVVAEAATIAGVDLQVGSGSYAHAVGSRGAVPPDGTRPPIPEKFGTMLALCGSRNPTSRRQIDTWSRKKKVRIFDVMAGKLDAAALVAEVTRELSSARAAAIRFDAPAGSGDRAPQILLDSVAAVARELTKHPAPAVCFLTGGETAWTFCEALEGETLDVIAEAGPGIVLASLLRRNGPSQLVITKPGGFGEEELLVRLHTLVK